MPIKEFDANKVHFNLRRACNNCPFRKSSPCHEGVAGDLIALHGQIEKGQFLHSCHKTDPRSDGWVDDNYKGPVQHCAGSLLMLKNMGKEYTQLSHLHREARKCMDRLKPDPDVFKSFLEMVEHYVPFIKRVVTK